MSTKLDDEVVASIRQVMEQYRRSVSTFAATGTAVLTTDPTGLRLSITIRGKGPDRTRAYDGFQKQLKELTDAIDGLGSYRTSSPCEIEDEDPKGKAKDDRFKVEATVWVTLDMASFGDLLKIVVDQNLPFDTPTFTFPSVESVPAELFGEAAKAAFEKATAVATNGGFRVGAVVAVDCGDKKVTAPEIVNEPRGRWGGFDDHVLHSPLGQYMSHPFSTVFEARVPSLRALLDGRGKPEDELPEIDQSILGLLTMDIPVQQQTATVTIEYQIAQLEAAA